MGQPTLPSQSHRTGLANRDIGEWHVAAPVPRRRAKRPQRTAGFSTIELAVAMVVASITLAVAIPAFQKLNGTNELLGASDQFAGHLRIARQKAVAMGIPHIVIWNDVSRTYVIVRDQNGNGAPDAGEQTDGPFALPDRIDIQNAGAGGFSGNSVVFSPAGSASESGSVELTNDRGHVRALTLLAPTGLVKVE